MADEVVGRAQAAKCVSIPYRRSNTLVVKLSFNAALFPLERRLSTKEQIMCKSIWISD